MSSDRGAPTGVWETKPPNLEAAPAPPDMTKLKAHLIVRRPETPEVDIPVEKTEFSIGRDSQVVDLALDDDLVSRKHALLKFSGRGYVQLVDLESRNGIQFQGRTVRKLNLVDGDEFSIGKAQFVFHAELDRFRQVSAPPPPLVEAQSPMDDEMSLLAEDIPEPNEQSED